ncbi:hypothetical protein ECSP_1870 [Escherichia coli O157:H7 str. TW14359]|nr:hypothetical protein ECSP_1870 [Escherichia coli O157:H7 str. TW14359]
MVIDAKSSGAYPRRSTLTMRQFNRFFIGWWVRHGLRARDRIGHWNRIARNRFRDRNLQINKCRHISLRSLGGLLKGRR